VRSYGVSAVQFATVREVVKRKEIFIEADVKRNEWSGVFFFPPGIR
jgi:hypothetical protein